MIQTAMLSIIKNTLLSPNHLTVQYSLMLS